MARWISFGGNSPVKAAPEVTVLSLRELPYTGEWWLVPEVAAALNVVEVAEKPSANHTWDDATGDWRALTVEEVAAKTAAELSTAKAARKATLADYRWRREISGTMLNGMALASDRDTQTKLIGARISAKEDPTYTLRWKAPAGFVTLDAATIIVIADHVRDYVTACFSREDALVAAIDACTTVAEVEGLDITTGWPT